MMNDRRTYMKINFLISVVPIFTMFGQGSPHVPRAIRKRKDHGTRRVRTTLHRTSFLELMPMDIVFKSPVSHRHNMRRGLIHHFHQRTVCVNASALL